MIIYSNDSFPRSTKRCHCPFPSRYGSSRRCNGLHSHFNSQHCGDSISILEEHPKPLPRCECYGIQVPAGRLNICHYASENCKQVKERQRQRETLKWCFKASKVSFQINTEALSPSEAFPNIRRKITYSNSDWAVVYQNTRNVRRRWGMIVRVLVNTGEMVRAWGTMYKAVTQLVLLKMLICYKLILTNYEGLDVITSLPSYVYYQVYRLFNTYGFPRNYQLVGSGGTYEFLLYS